MYLAKIPGVVPGQLRVVRRLGFCSPSCDRWRTRGSESRRECSESSADLVWWSQDELLGHLACCLLPGFRGGYFYGEKRFVPWAAPQK